MKSVTTKNLVTKDSEGFYIMQDSDGVWFYMVDGEPVPQHEVELLEAPLASEMEC